jgi:hypothetical protein
MYKKKSLNKLFRVCGVENDNSKKDDLQKSFLKISKGRKFCNSIFGPFLR